MNRPLSRRRVLSILAAGAALPVLKRGAGASALQPYRWQGIVLGASGDLTLYAASRAAAMDAMDAALTECARLEAIFSLHQPDSALSRLNRAGRLEAAPFELLELTSQALALAAASDGRFEPTIQPLWKLYADHFAVPGADPTGPDGAVLARVLRRIDHRGVRLDADGISFDRPGMQITLNGIAQGYISDRIGALLQARGFTHTLVNLGEGLALDRKPDGSAWQIGISAPADHDRLVATIELAGGAIATSAARGLLFTPDGRFNHIIDPARLSCAAPDRSVTVLAPSAAAADGLSTLAALAPDPRRDLPAVLARHQARAYLIDAAHPQGSWIS
jgi:thiamine biosynthesis lipoprotein